MNALKMIGIDTNIAIRLLTRDDEKQFALASSLFSSSPGPGHLCLNIVTLTEIVWVLESRLRLSIDKARTLTKGLVGLEETRVLFNAQGVDLFGLLDSNHIGWTDVIVSELNLRGGCDFTYTFDKRAARHVPGMKLLQ